jgi:hypothetical protein
MMPQLRASQRLSIVREGTPVGVPRVSPKSAHFSCSVVSALVRAAAARGRRRERKRQSPPRSASTLERVEAGRFELPANDPELKRPERRPAAILSDVTEERPE